jgi:hypothetical protein
VGIFRAGQRPTAARLNAIANSSYTSTTALSGSTTTASGSYVDMPTGSTLAGFTKHHADTALLVYMDVNWVSAGSGNTFARFAVQISGADYDVSGGVVTEVSSWQSKAGFVRIAGLPAGTYTIQGRWRRSSGSGTLTANDWFSLLVVEAQ